MSNAHGPGKGVRPPAPQQNFDTAAKLGFEAVEEQPAEQLLWLGAQPRQYGWQVPVLNDVLEVDLSAKRVSTSAGQGVRPPWTILTLHYLAITARPEQQAPEVTFADLATARSYAGVYHARVVARLCATAGRDAQRLGAAAGALGGRSGAQAAGDAAFDFSVFPRVSVRLVWHAPDEEFPPSATLLLPENIESYFCSEDIVVLSELLVSRLGGGRF